MHHRSLRPVTEGAGGRACKSYPVQVLGESCVMAAAKPGQVDAVLPREGHLGRGNPGRTGTQQGVSRGRSQRPRGELTMYVSSLREASWAGGEGEVKGAVVFSRRVVYVTSGGGGCLHVVEGVGW